MRLRNPDHIIDLFMCAVAALAGIAVVVWTLVVGDPVMIALAVMAATMIGYIAAVVLLDVIDSERTMRLLEKEYGELPQSRTASRDP